MFVFVALILAFQFAFPGVALAQDNSSLDPCAGGNGTNLDICTAEGFQFSDAIGVLIQFMFVIAVILALGFLVYGGIKWITSGGDKGGVEAARNMIIAAVIGLILVFLSYVILNLVLEFLTGGGIGDIKIPSLNPEGGGSSGPRGTGPIDLET